MIKHISLIAFSIWLTSTGCSSTLEDPDGVIADQKLQISTVKAILAGNASDTTHVLARVPLDAGQVDITFTTTKGTFVQTEAKTIKQQADSIAGLYRFAVVVLRSDSSKGTVYITAETGTSRNRSTITFN